MTTLVNFSQNANDNCPIEVTVFGTTTSVTALLSSAKFGIILIPEGRIIFPSA